MKQIRFSLLVLILLTLFACKPENNEIDPFISSLEKYYQQEIYGYDYTVIQSIDNTVVQTKTIELRINNSGPIQAYTWVQTREILEFGDTKFQHTEQIYYYNDGELITEQNQSYTTSTITFEEYQQLEPIIIFTLDTVDHSTTTITGDNNILEATINQDGYQAFGLTNSHLIQNASIRISITQEYQLELAVLTVEYEQTTIVISLSPLYEQPDVLIPDIN